MTIGELNRRVEVLEFQEERDSYGAVVGDWIVVGRVWAKIVPGIGNEHYVNQQVEGSQNAIITMRFYPAMSIKHRIRYGETVYEVKAVKDEITSHRWTEITVEEIKKNGQLFSETTETEGDD